MVVLVGAESSAGHQEKASKKDRKVSLKEKNTFSFIRPASGMWGVEEGSKILPKG